MNPVHINTGRIIAVVSLIVFSAWSGFAEERITTSATRFKASSIKGDYGFTCTGTVNGNPFAGIGQVSCDGRSTCWGAGTLNPNGISLPWTFIGSYTLGADGRGQVTYDQTVAVVLPVSSTSTSLSWTAATKSVACPLRVDTS